MSAIRKRAAAAPLTQIVTRTKRPRVRDVNMTIFSRGKWWLLSALADLDGGPFLWIGATPPGPPDQVDYAKYVAFTVRGPALYEAAKNIVAAYEWHEARNGGRR